MSDDGLEGLTGAARQHVLAADLVLGPPDILQELSEDVTAEQCEIPADLEGLVATIEANWNRAIVLFSPGDPLFYGVARFVCERLGKEHFEVVPHVSSMQLAFARVKESWDEAYLANVANVGLDPLIGRIRGAEKVGLFTSDTVSPADVAQRLVEEGVDCFTAYVCENLGSPDERVTHGELSDVATQGFSPLNVMILVRKPNLPDRPVHLAGRRRFGNPDEVFRQSRPKRGLLTPQEVRVLALAELDLSERSVVWDVGAGSGCVAVEAASLAPQGSVFAIEMDPEDHQLIRDNGERFGVQNLTAVLGVAPDAWRDLPDPDAVFIGGTGRTISQIARHAYQRLRPGGRLVANVASLDNLYNVQHGLREEVGDARVAIRMVNIANATEQLDRVRFEAMNPTFLISTVKPSAASFR